MQSALEVLHFLRRRAGIYLNRARRSVWIHARTADDFEAIAPLLRRLRTAVATDRLLLTSERPTTCLWLRTRYPNDNVLPPPWGVRPLVARFFHQLGPLMILCVGADNVPGAAVLERARREQVPVVLLDVGNVPPASVLPLVDHFGARTQAVAAELAARGVPRDRIHVTGAARDDAQATLDLVIELTAPLPAPVSGLTDRTAPRRMDQLARTPIGRFIVSTRRGRQLNDVSALRRRLGNPDTILCLGNGPSSEHPQLSNVVYDNLFRVNCRWLERGVLTRPDMVFVGDLRTTARVRACVFGFRTLAWESEVLLRQLALYGRWRQLEYFTYERVSPFLSDSAWPTHPTNGAVMVATAVALQPKRIIVAGIDLYLDPRGRYPGDASPENDFPQMHSRAVEVEILARLLASFHGETIILGEPLRRALATRRLETAAGGTQVLAPGNDRDSFRPA